MTTFTNAEIAAMSPLERRAHRHAGRLPDPRRRIIEQRRIGPPAIANLGQILGRMQACVEPDPMGEIDRDVVLRRALRRVEAQYGVTVDEVLAEAERRTSPRWVYFHLGFFPIMRVHCYLCASTRERCKRDAGPLRNIVRTRTVNPADPTEAAELDCGHTII